MTFQIIFEVSYDSINIWLNSMRPGLIDFDYLELG